MHSGFLTAVAVLAGTPAFAVDVCEGSRDLRLTNGRIVTMDQKNSIVSEVS